MPEKTRTIRIFEEDYQKIASEGKFGESQAEVVHRMLNRQETHSHPREIYGDQVKEVGEHGSKI